MLAFDKFTGNEVISLSLGTNCSTWFYCLNRRGREGNFGLLKWPWNPNKNVIARPNKVSEM